VSSTLITRLIADYGYLAAFALIALESLGVPLPGEAALVAASVYAGSTRELNNFAIAAVAVCAAVAGDNAGYWLGRRGGLALVERYGHYVRLDRRRLKIGRYLFARHGFAVVSLGRFVSVLRTYAAFLAGLSRMPAGTFALANAAGGLVWAVGYAAAGYEFGYAAGAFGSAATLAGLAVTTLLTLAGAVVLRKRMGRLQQRADAMFPEPADYPAANCSRALASARSK
jgi:membrane protein DedA with SNARE-associated domain